MKVGTNQSCPLPGLLTCALLKAQDLKRKSCKLANCTAKARGCNPCPFIKLKTWENLFITTHEVVKKGGGGSTVGKEGGCVGLGAHSEKENVQTVTILLQGPRRNIHTQRRTFLRGEEDRGRQKKKVPLCTLSCFGRIRKWCGAQTQWWKFLCSHGGRVVMLLMKTSREPEMMDSHR